MRYGVCASNNFREIKSAGYDYVEINLTKLQSLSEEDFLSLKAEIGSSGLAAETSNCFLPRSIAVTGPGADENILREYTLKAMERFTMLGGQISVFGSGANRIIPPGCTYEDAYEQLLQSVGVIAAAAGEYGVKIAVEPLNAGETPLINTVAEGLEFCGRLDTVNAGCLVDSFHAYKSKETYSAVENSGGAIIHAHIAALCDDRHTPRDRNDLLALRPFAEALKTCGYNDRISLESSFGENFIQEITKARKIMEIFD